MSEHHRLMYLARKARLQELHPCTLDHTKPAAYLYNEAWGAEPAIHPGPSLIRDDDPQGHTFRCYPQKLVKELIDNEIFREERDRHIS